MTLSEAQAKRDELLAKIAGGEKSVHFSDRGIENQSMADLLKAVQYLDSIIASGTGTPAAGSVTSFASHSRD